MARRVKHFEARGSGLEQVTLAQIAIERHDRRNVDQAEPCLLYTS